MYNYTLNVIHSGKLYPFLVGNTLPALRARALKALTVAGPADYIGITNNRTGATEYYGKAV